MEELKERGIGQHVVCRTKVPKRGRETGSKRAKESAREGK